MKFNLKLNKYWKIRFLKKWKKEGTYVIVYINNEAYELKPQI
jgi:hypothetical protein